MEDTFKNKISKMVKERLEETESTQPVAAPEGGSSNYDKIAAILNNPLINTAEIARQLWGSEDEDTNRSLFKKKLDRAKNDSGSIYHFDDGELLKITTALMNFSTLIRKSVGRQGKA